MVDRKAVLRAALISDLGDAFYTLVANRVVSPIPPSGWENQNPAVVFHFESNLSQRNAADHSTAILFKFYGGSASFADAEAIFIAFRNRVTISMKGVVTPLIEIVNDFEGGADPDFGYPFYVAQCRVRFN